MSKKDFYPAFYLTLYFFCVSCASTKISNMNKTEKFEIAQDETRLWKRAEEFRDVLDNSGFIYHDEQMTSYLNEVLHKIAGEYETTNNVQLKVFIIKDPLFNAFALPDGAIYVHTSILAQADNEAQVALVLAHEATHFLHRHALKQFRSVINKTAFLSFFQLAMAGVRVVTPANIGSSLNLGRLFGEYLIIGSVSGYGRSIEAEADEKAFEMVRNAGYDPREAKKFFEKLEKANKEDDVKVPYFYSSHPQAKWRLHNMERLIKNYEKQKGEPLSGMVSEDRYNAIMKEILLVNAQLDMKRGKYKLAQEQIERFNTIQPDDYRSHAILGELYLRDDKKEEAQAALKKSIELKPDFPESHRTLGMLYYKRGEKDKAKPEFEKYLQLNPDSMDAAYIRGYMNE